MQLEPLYTIPLVYQLTDPLDSSTYYVRSIVKDSSTGAVLNSATLTARGSGRYTGSITAPQDPTGFGRHIDVVTSVYTNAGMTTYSENYQLKVDNYVIRRTTPSFGSGGGSDVDYEKIRKIIAEEVKTCMDGMEMPETDLKPVMARFDDLAGAINSIEMPEPMEMPPPPEKVDLSPVLNEVRKIIPATKTLIDSIEKPDEIDLKPVIEAVKNVGSNIDEKHALVQKSIEAIQPAFTETLKDEFGKSMKAITEDPGGGVMVVETSPMPEEKVVDPYGKFFPSPENVDEQISKTIPQ